MFENNLPELTTMLKAIEHVHFLDHKEEPRVAVFGTSQQYDATRQYLAEHGIASRPTDPTDNPPLFGVATDVDRVTVQRLIDDLNKNWN
jgi:hypothetical protein